MACTTQLMKPKAKSCWTSTFPDSLKTEVGSNLFMKKLIAIAVSNITYLRGIFPEEAYGDRALEDISLKILSEHDTCPSAKELVNWIRGCFDALDRKYLRQLMIGVYTDENEPDNVIEAYTFVFTYHDKATSLSCNGEPVASIPRNCPPMEMTRKATLCLLRTIVILTRSLDPLPKDAFMVMKLLYYDEVTPPDYEPPGFESAETDSFLFKNKPFNVKIGDVTTPYHSLKLRIKTNKKQFDFDDVPASQEMTVVTGSNKDSENVVTMDNALTLSASEPDIQEKIQQTNNKTKRSFAGDAGDSIKVCPSVKTLEVVSVPKSKCEKQTSKTGKVERKELDKQELFKRKNGNIVQCPCGDNVDDGLMVQCSVCYYWQHGACFALLSEENAPDIHICQKCADVSDENNKPTDPYLCNLTPIEQQAVSLWRRVLLMCSEDNRQWISITNISSHLDIEKTVADSIMKRLENEGFVSARTSKNKYKNVVMKDALKNIAFPKYFLRTQSSQSSQQESNVSSSTRKSVLQLEIDSITDQTKEIHVSSAVKDKRKRRSETEKELSMSFDKLSTEEIQSESGLQHKKQKVSQPKRRISM